MVGSHDRKLTNPVDSAGAILLTGARRQTGPLCHVGVPFDRLVGAAERLTTFRLLLVHVLDLGVCFRGRKKFHRASRDARRLR